MIDVPLQYLAPAYLWEWWFLSLTAQRYQCTLLA
jgi:hypothetical protein